jgi:hypothetical protein
MKYYVLSTVFGEGKGRHIETEKNIEELISESVNGLIELTNGSFISVDLLRNCEEFPFR